MFVKPLDFAAGIGWEADDKHGTVGYE